MRDLSAALFLFVVAVILSWPVSTVAQPCFSENLTWQENIVSSLSPETGIQQGAFAFFDIDNDADLDLVLTGAIDVEIFVAKVYVNNGTTLIESQAWQQDLTSVKWSSQASGDFNNDGNLDLVIIGCNNTTSQSLCTTSFVAKVYINNGTSLVENQTWQQNLTALYSGSITLGDIDNDGDLDMVLTGAPNLMDHSLIYINNGTTLVEDSTWSQNLIEVYRSSTGLGDIDNDGDLDLVLTGQENGFARSKIYINNGTSFVEDVIWEDDLISVTRSSVAFGDYDNDGDLDLMIAGMPDSHYLYENNGTSFRKNQTHRQEGGWLVGIYDGSIAFGDYDNDGDLDIVSTGNEGYTTPFINNATYFEEDIANEEILTDLEKSSLIFGDIDEDRDLDLVLAGYSSSEGKLVKIFINNVTSSNTVPNPSSPPANNYSYNNGEITLVWGNGSDTETPSAGLYYNLRVGTASNRNAIVSGVYGGSSNPTAGYFGNMMQRKNITLKVDRLQPSTTYYWSVQTIDTALANGSWCEEQSFTTPADMEKPEITVNFPQNGYAHWNFTVVFNVTVSDNLNVTNVSLWGNWTGGWHLNETNSSGANGTDYVLVKDLSADGDGPYVWSVLACDNETNCRSTGNYTFTIDSQTPGVKFVYPTPGNGTNLSASSFVINISHNETNPDTLIFNWNGTNTSYGYSGNYTLIVKSNLSDGVYTYFVWVNDTAGNLNQTETRKLVIDTVPVSNIDFVDPTPPDASSRSENFTFVNVSLSEIPDACLLEWDDGLKGNLTMTGSGTNCYKNMTELLSYIYSYRVYANDSAGNWNASELRTVTVDTGNPMVILASPQHGSWDPDGTIAFSYNASDANLDSCSLYGNWSGGWHLNETNSSPNNGTYSNFAKILTDGSYVWNVICSDSASNEGHSPSNLTMNVDMAEPLVVILYPQNVTHNSDPVLNFSYSENNPDSCWYNLNGGGNESLASCDTNGTLMNSDEGTNYLVLFMNDSAGNVNSSFRYWTLDTTPPGITIDSPGNQSYRSFWLWANLTLDENALWCGYSLNGSNNVSMGNDSATHFYHNLSGLNEASHNITFSCNDTVGNMNATQTLHFTVDRTKPEISGVSNETPRWNGIEITWNTSEPASSSILYGTNITDFPLNETNSSLVANHNLTLSGLSGSTTYYYNVSSCDSAGNCNKSGAYNFTTPACVESWAYGEWSACAGGIQTRTATDLNGCGTIVNRLPLSRTCTTVGGGGTTIPAAIPPYETFTWVEINPGETATMSIENADICFTRIDFQVVTNVSDAKVIVARLQSKPGEIDKDAPGHVYQYVNISHTDSLNRTSLRNITIVFGVNRAWISQNSIDKTTITLNRYEEDVWDVLNTRLVGETGDSVDFESLSPGFSYFAITGEWINTTAPPCNNNSVCEPETGETESICPSDCTLEPGKICVPETKRCSGDNLEQCNPGGTEWVNVQNCLEGCRENRCIEGYPQSADYTTWTIVIAVIIIAAGIILAFLHEKKRLIRSK